MECVLQAIRVVATSTLREARIESMRVLLPIVLLIALPAILASSPSLAQSSAGWQDDLANHMTGTWTLNGKAQNHDAYPEVTAEWVLDHRSFSPALHTKRLATLRSLVQTTNSR
jgi:hypothetical protein